MRINFTLLFILLIFSPQLLAGLAEPLVKWPKQNIVVCWGEKKEWENSKVWSKFVIRQGHAAINKFPLSFQGIAFEEKTKEQIKNVVQFNFTKEITGIHFTGWKDCKDTGKPDLYLLRMHIGDSLAGKASIGYGSKIETIDYQHNNDIINKKTIQDLSDTRKEYVLINTDHSIERILSTAVHEFGHVAGLRHEHANPSLNKKDQNCINYKKTFHGEMFPEMKHLTTERYSEYDSNSIMNYCFYNFIDNFKTHTMKAKGKEELPIHLFDSSIYVMRKVSNEFEFKVLPRLSTLDKHSIKCLYKEDYNQANCNEFFKYEEIRFPDN